MENRVALIIFGHASQRYALPLTSAERAVRAVELTPVAEAPRCIRGIFSWHGRVVPVGDFRRRLGEPEREVSSDDYILITRWSARVLGVLAEESIEVSSCGTDDLVSAEAVIHGAEVIAGIVRLSGGLVLVQDLARFLALEEERAPDTALRDASRRVQ